MNKDLYDLPNGEKLYDNSDNTVEYKDSVFKAGVIISLENIENSLTDHQCDFDLTIVNEDIKKHSS